MALPWCLPFRAGAPSIVALAFADCDCAVDDLHPACLLTLPLMFLTFFADSDPARGGGGGVGGGGG